ncbi:Arm DNA-binding domain-containing protein [Virgibacillus proomii]|uniref:Arm DNA-binding domain-containing protein n=1 Tax=Virgibacillus proomii TaxID=84407 RepID=UPI001C128AEF|nr:Arm DNA-binding domain-containing protein [Virgibacillus proomii]MBU5267595.1 Arm DNA-binding domain-containing protein [Virgibacillus proomii]
MASYKKYQSKSGLRWLVQISLGKDPITGKYKSTTRRGFKTKKEAEAAAREILIRHSKFICFLYSL